jgi:hypothetical protein
MNRKWASLTLPIILFTALSSARSIGFAQTTAVQQQKQQPKSEGKPGGSSLTGCIDEQDGHYVLVDDRTLTAIANLEADGFPTEAFAKHLGHKVTVRGISNSGTGRPIFKVQSVDTVSETCAPNK